jgi:hypothetical protein
MTRMPSAVSWSVGLLLGWAALGCTPGGVGDPCTPEDEYQQGFNGFQVTETNVESRSFQCETRLCLVNHFQGRVSCRLGQKENVGALNIDGNPNPTFDPTCSVPGTTASNDRNSKDNVNVTVPAQLKSRQAEQAVYCSCRCDGPDDKARYCECPEGFQCEKLVEKLDVGDGGGAQLAGSYCIRAGSKYDPIKHSAAGTTCADEPNNCGCDPNAEEYPAECGRKPAM